MPKQLEERGTDPTISKLITPHNAVCSVSTFTQQDLYPGLKRFRIAGAVQVQSTLTTRCTWLRRAPLP